MNQEGKIQYCYTGYRFDTLAPVGKSAVFLLADFDLRILGGFFSSPGNTRRKQDYRLYKLSDRTAKIVRQIRDTLSKVALVL